MPKFTQYIAQQQVSGAVATRGGAEIVDLSGVERLGRDLQQRQAQLQAQQDAERKRLEHNEAVGYTVNTMAQADIDWRERLQREENGDPEGMTDRALSGFDEYRSEKLDSAPAAARPMLQQDFARLRSQLHARAFLAEVKGRQASVLRAQDDGIDSDARAVLEDPALFQETLARRQGAARALDIPEDTRARLATVARDRLVMAAATGYAQQYPRETLAALGQAPSSPHYDAGTQTAVLQAINASNGMLTDAKVVPGMLKAGNIDLSTRPRVRNADGSISTIRSMSTNIDGREVLLPTVSDDGRIMSDAEAIAHYKKTGKMLGAFDSPESADAYAQALHDQQAAAIGEKQGHPALAMLPFDRVDDIARVARTSIERDVSTMRVSLNDRARDINAAVGAGIPVSGADVAGLAEQYTTAYGPVDGARRYQEQIGVALSISDALGRMRSASPQERAAIIQGAAVTGIEGAADQSRVHEAAVKADEIIRQQLKTDPAAYALTTSPDVKAAYGALSGAQSVEQIRAANDAYARATRAEQERLGAPSPQLLTKAQGEAYGRQFTESQPKDMVQLVSGLELAWGGNWPAVYSQLAKEDKLPPAALVIPNMKDEGSKLRLAQASALKPTELDAIVTPADKKDVHDKLQQQFAPLAQTMAAQSLGSMRTLSTIADQAERLAIFYRGTGKSAGDAARQAFDEVAGWRYQFFDTYRVPNSEQPTDVRSGAVAALRDLGRVALFDSPYPMGAANRARQSLDAVKANAFWATNEDESGLVLKVKGQDNADYVAYREDGKRVEYKWQDLRRMAIDVTSSDERVRQSSANFETESARRRQQAEEQARLQRLREAGMR